VADIPGIERIRYTTSHPKEFTQRLIDVYARVPQLVNHLHLPVQHGSDRILMAMKRGYTAMEFKSTIRKLRAVRPNISVSSDFIVGFPGETEEHFLETYQFLNELDVSYLHVFPYSERANTTAKKMRDVVPVKVRMERGEMLRGLSEKKRMAFYREHLGTQRPVLFEEEERRGVMFGFTDNYIKVATDYDPLLVNTVANVTLSELDSEGWVNAAFDYAGVEH
jgi:threonylcarbamoyladenosine tRNA methylthiotransferase MtaB